MAEMKLKGKKKLNEVACDGVLPSNPGEKEGEVLLK